MADPAAPVKDLLVGLGEAVRDDFTRNRRVMSFAEYLNLVVAEPTRQLRSSTQYIVDCFDHYGSETVKYPWGEVRHFKLFDAPWANGEDRLFGQEHGPERGLSRAAQLRAGRPANKLILLHGPNGSAKSTFIRCLGRGARALLDARRGRAVPVLAGSSRRRSSTRGGIGFGGGSGRRASRRSSRSRTCPTT